LSLVKNVRHEARLNERGKDGVSAREHLEGRLRMALLMGKSPVIEGLDPPPFPDCLTYLRDWLFELHGRSGLGMSGAAPLSYATIEYWAKLNDITVQPHEVQALLVLDSVYLNPGKPEARE
jgi:hypothetical protein